MLVQDFLTHTADRLGGKVALVTGAGRWTYGEIRERVHRLAHRLRDAGVERGDRVVIALPAGLEAVVAIFAALEAGGVFVVLPPSIRRERFLYVLRDCTPAALLAVPRLPDGTRTAEAAREIPGLRLVALAGNGPGRRGAVRLADLLATGRTDRPPRRNIDLDLACLVYTSGSTGWPKGVMCDHSNVVFASGAIIKYLGNVEDDVVLNVLPLSFDYGLYQVLMTFRFGGTLVLERSFAYPVKLLERIEEERVTGLPVVPTMLALLLRQDFSRYDLSSLRWVTNTGAALPPEHVRELRRRLPRVRVFPMYGLTETKRTLWMDPERALEKPGSVGRPIPGTETWLVDEEGRRVDPPGTGQLVVRGRHVMRGYWNDPEATAKRFRPGPLPGERVCYTGDLFRVDEEGDHWFLGRMDEIFKSRGEKVAPSEVERVLVAAPGVHEAAVTGVPDPLLGHRVVAFIVPSGESVDLKAIRHHCRRHLEERMLPAEIRVVRDLPRLENGKLDRGRLAALAGEGPAGRPGHRARETGDGPRELAG